MLWSPVLENFCHIIALLSLLWLMNLSILCHTIAEIEIPSILEGNFANVSNIINTLLKSKQDHIVDAVNINMFKSYGGMPGILSTSRIKPTLNDYSSLYNTIFSDFRNHSCRRACQSGQPMTCYYALIVHNYQRMGDECKRCLYDPNACDAEQCIFGDGVPNDVFVVNRQLPAPAIELCIHDMVVVDVYNYLTEDVTMHWHGIPMVQTPEMDGAPYVTQYPLRPVELQRYAFPVDRSGTLWYHSEMGWQRALGVAGSFIVRQPHQDNKYLHLYDYDLLEHTIILQDIIYSFDYQTPRNILVNGKGRNHLSTLPDNDFSHRYERLSVTRTKRYRIRIISNGVFNCPVEFSIQNHRMLIIATDGNDIEPIYADTLFLTAGERYDVILEANQIPGNYWIRIRGYEACATLNLYQGAILHYRNAGRRYSELKMFDKFAFTNSNKTIHPHINVNVLQHINATSVKAVNNSSKVINVVTTGLQSLTPPPWSRYTKFLSYYTSFGVRTELNGEQYFQVDDISYLSPDVSMLQARHLYNEDLFYCNQTAFMAVGKNCLNSNCQCTNVVRIPAYKPIEIIVVNYMDVTNPFHLHGYTFRLIGQGVVGNVSELRKVRDLDCRNELNRLPDDFPAVEKDTVQIPSLGYIIIRFLSNNPGFWMYHCFIESKSLYGMVGILKVGESSQMKKLPPKFSC